MTDIPEDESLGMATVIFSVVTACIVGSILGGSRVVEKIFGREENKSIELSR